MSNDAMKELAAAFGEMLAALKLVTQMHCRTLDPAPIYEDRIGAMDAARKAISVGEQWLTP